MRVQEIAVAIVAVWALSAATVAVGSAHVTSLADGLALALFGALPALGIWFWLNDPSETMHESRHRIREAWRTPRRRTAD